MSPLNRNFSPKSESPLLREVPCLACVLHLRQEHIHGTTRDRQAESFRGIYEGKTASKSYIPMSIPDTLITVQFLDIYVLKEFNIPCTYNDATETLDTSGNGFLRHLEGQPCVRSCLEDGGREAQVGQVDESGRCVGFKRGEGG